MPPRHEPDLHDAALHRAALRRRRRLRVQIDGAELRHYPDTDTLEIDSPRIRASAPTAR